MSAPTLQGRVLAITAGSAFASGGLTILLGADLLHPFDWAASQWLTILTVFGTIAAGHLMFEAGRRHWLAAIGFGVLFLSGTGLVVYSSVGRQVETVGIAALSIEDTNQQIANKSADLKGARSRRDYANAQADREMTGSRCGRRCKDWKTNAADISVVIGQIEADIAALGPQKPVNAQAAAMADIVLLFPIPATKGQIVAVLTLLVPFLKTMFFEIGVIVSLGFAFRPGLSRTPANDDIPEIPTNRNSGNSGPSKPPKSGRRGRKANPNVIDFSEKFQKRTGRAPTAGELKAAFPGMATSTAYEYAARCRGSSRKVA